MKITLEFDNLREMQNVIDKLFILFPENLNPEGGGYGENGNGRGGREAHPR